MKKAHKKEGVLSREKGRTGYLIGRYASDNLYSMYRNGDISDSKTATIADITRGDEALEGGRDSCCKEQYAQFPNYGSS